MFTFGQNCNKLKKIIVVGAGIVGLAHALEASKRGYAVEVFERNGKPLGASIRNFGMVWPIGQPVGKTFERALRSREVWLSLSEKVPFFLDKVGSIHAAYRQDELMVMEEFFEQQRYGPYELSWVNSANVGKYSEGVRHKGFMGGFYSATESIVDPRQALAAIPGYLEEVMNVKTHWNTAVLEVQEGKVKTRKGWHDADHVFICSGSDFEMLYPEVFAQTPITKCKLQMMRTGMQPANWRLGAALAGGLTLTHYQAFESCRSLETLKQRIEEETPFFPEYGIHVMVSQNSMGELIIGDSHEYGMDPWPFDRADINQAIFQYLIGFLDAPDLTIKEYWHGIYPKMKDGATEFIYKPNTQTTVVNGLGGAGMTLSFGLAQEVLDAL